MTIGPGLALVNFLRRRAIFAKHLREANAAMSQNAYIRLMLLICVEMFWSVLVLSLLVWVDFQGTLLPYDWTTAHRDVSRIRQVSKAEFGDAGRRTWFYLLHWPMPLSAYIVFAFFITSEEVAHGYAKMFGALERAVRCRCLGRFQMCVLAAYRGNSEV
jgi:pheromone a factor receptor